MAKRNTLVTFLLDRSGSMHLIRTDTIGAFNTYLKTLQDSGEPITFSLIQFDTVGLETVAKNLPVKDAKPLTMATFQPRGSTPLIDAAYRTIQAVQTALEARKDKSKVVICIQTDGEENSSREHTWEDLEKLIKEKTELGWQFNFMGAGIDAYQQASRMGLGVAQTVSYGTSKEEMTAGFMAAAANAASFAGGMSVNTHYTVAQKNASGDKFDPSLVTRTPAGAASAAPPKRTDLWSSDLDL